MTNQELLALLERYKAANQQWKKSYEEQGEKLNKALARNTFLADRVAVLGQFVEGLANDQLPPMNSALRKFISDFLTSLLIRLPDAGERLVEAAPECPSSSQEEENPPETEKEPEVPPKEEASATELTSEEATS